MEGQIAALKNGNLDEFRLVYAAYHSKLYHFIFSRTQSEYVAQEVVQLTFIKFWERRQNISTDYTVDIQLFRIARTVLIDELRKERTRQRHNDLATVGKEEAFDLMRAEGKDELKHVFAAIEDLPPVRKKVFKLSRINGLPYKDIAAIMSLSPKTVENHISRAIKQLRNAIHIWALIATVFALEQGNQQCTALKPKFNHLKSYKNIF